MWPLVEEEQEDEEHLFLFADLDYNLRTYSMELWALRALVAYLVFSEIGPVPHSSGRHYEDNGNDEAVKGERLGKDHHQNERNQNILLAVGADTSVADNTDSQTSSQGGKSAAKARGELLVAKGIVIDPVLRGLGNLIIVGNGFD